MQNALFCLDCQSLESMISSSCIKYRCTISLISKCLSFSFYLNNQSILFYFFSLVTCKISQKEEVTRPNKMKPKGQCTDGSVALACHNKDGDLGPIPNSSSRCNTPVPVRHSVKKRKKEGIFFLFLKVIELYANTTKPKTKYHKSTQKKSHWNSSQTILPTNRPPHFQTVERDTKPPLYTNTVI